MKKKLLSIISIIALSITNYSFSAKNVVVSAIVWNTNWAPVVISVNPASNPVLIKTNALQEYIIYYRDNEKDQLSYTITARSWATNPISWTVQSFEYDSSSWAYINIKYLAPATKVWSKTITLTLNDWHNPVVVKTLNVYIY